MEFFDLIEEVDDAVELEFPNNQIAIDTKPLVLREPLTWMQHAACKGSDHSKFFINKGQTKMMRETFKICQICVVKTSCLNFALDNYETGIWGGTSERERKKIRKGNKQCQQ